MKPGSTLDAECIARLLAALREVVEQKGYRGFGDPAGRGLYVDGVARKALQDEAGISLPQ